jgi:hypothetical protein
MCETCDMSEPRANVSAKSANQHPRAMRGLVACALVLEASFLVIHLAGTQAEQVGLVLLSYVIGGGAFGLLLWCLRDAGDTWRSGRAVVFVIAAAVVFRLTLLPLSAASSPDVHRYLWEGIVQAQGHNPYTLSPDAEELAPLRQEFPGLAQAVTFPEVSTIYPPFAQLLFLLNAIVFGGSLIGWKIVLLAFDAIVTLGLWLILRARGMSAVCLVGVLWCPLLLLETYEAGHLDLIGAALIVLALAAMDRGRPMVSGVILGLCINVKYLWPLLLLVLLTLRAARRRQAIALVVAAVATAAVAWLPYRSGITAALATARMFAETWSFNDLIFELVRLLPGPRWVPMVVVTTVLTVLTVMLARRQPKEIWPDVWLLMGTALLLSPVAYSWYFLWIVPGLILRPPLWLVAWVLCIPLLHVVDWRFAATGLWETMPWLWAIVSVVPGALLVKAWWRRLTRPGCSGSERANAKMGGRSCTGSFAGVTADET